MRVGEPNGARPIARGSALALAAAVLFGVTAPFIKVLAVHAGSFATAALLYAGAAVGVGVRPAGERGFAAARAHLGRVATVAVLGAVVAPACLAWGLQRTGALTASLVLNLEAVLTVLLARLVFREHLGRRVAAASALMVLGGAILAVRDAGTTASTGGLVAIAAATLAWALDNTLSRPLADLDPRAIVLMKATLGATLSTTLAFARGERWPTALAALGVLACGGFGYGRSLILYLEAQRVIGAARTGSLFALGPFVGAALAFALGEREGAGPLAAAAALFALGVYLHASERHGHRHRHEPMTHEHAHRHDDGHHTHVHDPPFVGEHTHAHAHESLEHDHAHGDDLHHRHEHG